MWRRSIIFFILFEGYSWSHFIHHQKQFYFSLGLISSLQKPNQKRILSHFRFSTRSSLEISFKQHDLNRPQLLRYSSSRHNIRFKPTSLLFGFGCRGSGRNFSATHGEFGRLTGQFSLWSDLRFPASYSEHGLLLWAPFGWQCDTPFGIPLAHTYHWIYQHIVLPSVGVFGKVECKVKCLCYFLIVIMSCCRKRFRYVRKILYHLILRLVIAHLMKILTEFISVFFFANLWRWM